LENQPSSSESFFPKNLMTSEFSPNRKFVQFLVKLRNNPGALQEVAGVVSKRGVNIMSGFHGAPPDVSEGFWSFFADLTETESRLPDIVREISALPSVLDVRYREGASGFIADSFHFPPMWGGDPAVIMRRDALGGVFARVNEILGWGSAAGVIIYEMGEAAGRAGYQKFKAIMGDAVIEKEYLQIADVYRAIGWGIISFRRNLGNQRSVEAVIADNFECLHYKGQASSPRSQFVRGALAGWFSEMYHTRIKCTENLCIAKGDPYCEFTIEKTTQ